MNEHETTTEIIAEMETERPGLMNAQLNTNNSYYARRLKAAIKRERGDCAMLRKALEELVANIEMRSSTFGLNVIVDTKTYLDAKTALAATPRNCDRFASAEEAWDAYDEWVESYREKGKTEPFNEFGWLFASATEKEGGAK